MCAASAPSRIGRSPRWPEGSSVSPHQIDEDVLERALRGVQVLEPDACARQIGEQAGDAGARTLCVVGIDELAAAIGERKAMSIEFRRYGIERLMQLERHLFPPELVHQLGLVLDQDQLAFVDDADP